MKTLEKCECEKAAVYELLRTGMVGGSAQVFTRYHEKDITRIRSHVYEEKSKLTKGVIGYDANGLTLKYLTSFMTNLVTCHHCLLFKRFLIVIYLRK